ncbi:MAG: streptogramin lyase, partial [Myxococcota bacterium]
GIVVDCSLLPSSPGYNVLSGPRGYHGLLFDEDGYVLGSDNNSIIKADYKGATSVISPSQGYIEQLAWLADGDIVFSSGYSSSLKRLNPNTGGTSTLAGSTYAYGVIVGSDEMIYIADNQRIYRIDPKTGNKETVLGTLPGNATPRVLVFSEDDSVLYIGTLSNNGQVFSQAMDKDHEPVGQPVLYANGVGNGYHDGIALDVCGNLYVTDYLTRGIYRIATDGTVTTLLNNLGNDHGHGAAWGSGIGGWKEMALYLPLPYNNNNVMELGLGVPGVGWEGTVINK